jgi:hypothetical protein
MTSRPPILRAATVAILALALAFAAGAALTTRHFRIHLDATAEIEPSRLGEDLEALYAEYTALVGRLAPLRDPSGSDRLEIYAHDGPEGRRRLAEDRPDLRLAPVLYPGPALLQGRPALLVDAAGLLADADRHALFHGVIHLCHTALLYDEAVAGQWWVREGLAAYLSQAPYSPRHGFRLGEVRSSSGYVEDISPAGRVADTLSFSEEPRQTLESVRARYRKKSHVPLAQLLSHAGDRSWPDPETRDLAALESWVLVHFLLNGPEPELRGRFARYLELERKGNGGLETFRRLVSGDLEQLEPLVWRHVRQMD